MDLISSLDQVLSLKQHFIDTFKLIYLNILYKMLKNQIVKRIEGSFHMQSWDF